MDSLVDKRYWIWFSLIKGLGSRRKLRLLELYGSPEVIYNLKRDDLLMVEGIGDEVANNIVLSKSQRLLDFHISYMMKNNIDIINFDEECYPDVLREIYDPPVSLYVRGNKYVLNCRSIGIIGCRDCSQYGSQVAKYFACNLCACNFNVVSGLARGIDSFAHIGCLTQNFHTNSRVNLYENLNENVYDDCGKTIAVVGNGLDIIYPKENIELANRIIDAGGAIVSEYPCGTKPDKMNFPARNRIISGLCSGIVVVEAKQRSGTLITVDFALDQGRDVFVVPGNINSINSVGTNYLIRQGAMLVTAYEDILDFYC